MYCASLHIKSRLYTLATNFPAYAFAFSIYYLTILCFLLITLFFSHPIKIENHTLTHQPPLSLIFSTFSKGFFTQMSESCSAILFLSLMIIHKESVPPQHMHSIPQSQLTTLLQKPFLINPLPERGSSTHCTQRNKGLLKG